VRNALKSLLILMSIFKAAAFVGLAAAPLWTSKCSYLTDTGTIYAESKSIQKDIIINRFFGIFFLFCQSSLLTMSYLIPKKII
jgi:hypothetical protein